MNWLLILVPTLATSSAIASDFKPTVCYQNGGLDASDPIAESDDFHLACDFDSEVESCIWTHDWPMSVGVDSGPTSDVRCAAAKEQDGEPCSQEPRVVFEFAGERSCGIRVAGSDPEDTGVWRMDALAVSPSGSVQVSCGLNIFNYVIYKCASRKSSWANCDRSRGGF